MCVKTDDQKSSESAKHADSHLGANIRGTLYTAM